MSGITPANDDMEIINGIIEHITYVNSTNGYTVAILRTNEDKITVVGSMPFISVGDAVELGGSFDVHSTYGEQFKVEHCERSMPSTAASILSYLSSGSIKGIGPATARRLVERFGEKTLEIIENEPERLSELKGITIEKAEKIAEEYSKQFSVRDIMMFLARFKVSPQDALNVYRCLGSQACEIITKNPYSLCCEEIGFSFERAEEIAAAFSVPDNSDYRIAAGIQFVLRHNLLNGHTCLPKPKLLSVASRLLGCSTDEIDRICDELLSSFQLRSCEIDETTFIFLPNLYSSEEYSAARLSVLLKYAPPSEFVADLEIEYIENKHKIKYEEFQKKAITEALHKGVMVLTGGPGTGKTTTLNAMIKILETKGLNISLCAPTGRAAKRMSELTGCEAKTIHRMLEVEWSDSGKHSFARNEKNPLDCDVLIVDEMSMVDSLLFESLLRAIRLGCRLIMVGDADQLPSVGAGNVLHDIIASGLVPSVCLIKVFRQALESLIVTNAHAIMSGEPLVLDSKTSDFFMLQTTSSHTAAELVVDLCTKRLPTAYGFSPTTDIQVLCPSKMLDLGSVNLNNLLQDKLNPHNDLLPRITFKGFVLRQGDKVMQVKNNYDILWTNDGGEQGTGVFNGDIGVLENIDAKSGIFHVRFDDRLAVYFSENIGELELAYAMTIHKSQGSEFECVVLPVLDAPSKLLYRNLLYTAVTRAKKLLIIVGSKKVLESMISNNRKNLRYTSLLHRLEEMSHV